MTEKPIIFSTPMVKAILEGRKTMTRRVIKLKKGEVYIKDTGIIGCRWSTFNEYDGCVRDIKPPCIPGEVLWVREMWLKAPWFYETGGEEGIKYFYRADGEVTEQLDLRLDDKWKPSIYMPRDAARIFLKVTDVRVERVQDITEEDAKAEGVILNCEYLMNKGCSRGCVDNHNPTECGVDRHKIMFKELWDDIRAKRGYSWDSNPWVWIISFERVEE